MRSPRLAVFALSPIVTVTVEQLTTGAPEIHFHAGGQVLAGDELLELEGPRFTALDPHGTGDSMFAALGVGLALGMGFEEALPLAGAAGALNATRHGLGSGNRSAVERLVGAVKLRRGSQRKRAASAG